MIIRTQDRTGTFVFENCEGITPGGTCGTRIGMYILNRNGRYLLGTYCSMERAAQVQEQIAGSFTRNEKIYQMPAE